MEPWQQILICPILVEIIIRVCRIRREIRRGREDIPCRIRSRSRHP
nr:MAG TPA: hypothetical protein [Caudoviricetes sp.]